MKNGTWTVYLSRHFISLRDWASVFKIDLKRYDSLLSCHAIASEMSFIILSANSSHDFVKMNPKDFNWTEYKMVVKGPSNKTLEMSNKKIAHGWLSLPNHPL